MRYVQLLIFILFSQFVANAQSAYVRGSTVYTDKDEMFRLYNVGTIRHPAFKIKSLNENELILIDQSNLRNNQGTILMRFMFEGMPGMEAYLPYSVNFKKQLARLLVNYNVVKNNKLNIDGVKLLCKNYGLDNYPSKYIAPDLTDNSKAKKNPKQNIETIDNNNTNENVAEKIEPLVNDNSAAVNNSNNEEEDDDIVLENGIVKRDKQQQIYLSGNKIRQDYKEIGSFKEENKLLLGQEGKQITFYSYKGEQIAIARFINTDEQCELLIISDNKTWNIPIPSSDIFSIVKDIVQVLIDKSLM